VQRLEEELEQTKGEVRVEARAATALSERVQAAEEGLRRAATR
jgi:hypothetical protein